MVAQKVSEIKLSIRPNNQHDEIYNKHILKVIEDPESKQGNSRTKWPFTKSTINVTNQSFQNIITNSINLISPTTCLSQTRLFHTSSSTHISLFDSRRNRSRQRWLLSPYATFSTRYSQRHSFRPLCHHSQRSYLTNLIRHHGCATYTKSFFTLS